MRRTKNVPITATNTYLRVYKNSLLILKIRLITLKGMCRFICVFCRSLFVILHVFYFGHCFVCYSSIYGFWLPLWYLPLKTGGELRCPGRVGSSCSTSDTNQIFLCKSTHARCKLLFARVCMNMEPPPTPFFSFLYAYLFSMKFLYFFIIESFFLILTWS
jgi:hypothetical protein